MLIANKHGNWHFYFYVFGDFLARYLKIKKNAPQNLCFEVHNLHFKKYLVGINLSTKVHLFFEKCLSHNFRTKGAIILIRQPKPSK
jgi:hypothetical protein